MLDPVVSLSFVSLQEPVLEGVKLKEDCNPRDHISIPTVQCSSSYKGQTTYHSITRSSTVIQIKVQEGTNAGPVSQTDGRMYSVTLQSLIS